MKISCKPFELELKRPFSIAKFSRNSTPIVLLKLEHESFVSYGEASMVPYMGENHDSALAYLKKVDFNRFIYPFNFTEIAAYLDDLEKGNPAIKAAIDIALHDLKGKIENQPCHKMFKALPESMPVTSYTIGIDKPAVLKEKVLEAKGFKVLKIKLGRDNDKEIIETIRSITNVPLYVDANQGWNDRNKAIDLIYWLHNQGVVLIEQPMDKSNPEGNAWLTQRSPIPVLADEALQGLSDLDKLNGVYHGINVKLMKCAGMYQTYQIITKAKNMGMKVLIGCMSETSCATLAGAALAPLCNWSDLDGPWLTKNNPFKNPKMRDGKYVLSEKPGLGLIEIRPLFIS